MMGTSLPMTEGWELRLVYEDGCEHTFTRDVAKAAIDWPELIVRARADHYDCGDLLEFHAV